MNKTCNNIHIVLMKVHRLQYKLIIKVMVVCNTVNNVSIEKLKALRILGTMLQPQGKEPGQRDTTKNHGRLGRMCQTPGSLQKQPSHLPEKTGVQLLRDAN